ncbi:MmgE/PrpD family protein [Brucellaceae bacterium D45D]
MTLLEQIVARAAGGCPVTPADRRAAIDAIIDTIGCIVAGNRDEAPKAVKSARPLASSQGRSDLVGGGQAFAPEAAMLNGVAAHALDFDDNFGPGMSHASAVMVPALIALGQQKGVDGHRLIDAYLAGLEGQALVGQGVRPRHYTVGWHGTSTIGAIGSALGTAVIAGLSTEKSVMAMSLAVSTASGPKGQFGTSAKPFHAGVAARNAVEAALFAESGLRGRADILERPQGFAMLFSGDEPAHWELPAISAPHVISVEGLSPKLHPCCGSTHNAIDMIHDLRHEHGFGPDDIEHIETIVGLANFRNLSYPDPKDEMEARFSMQYCVALALYQDVLRLDDFTPEAVKNPKLRALFAKITMSVMPEAEERATQKPTHKIIVTLKDGRVLQAQRAYARGTIAAPLSEEAKRTKFIDCLGDRKEADAIYDQLLEMDELPDLGLIGRIIAQAP